MPYIDTLVDDIAQLLEEGSHTPEAPNVEKFGQLAVNAFYSMFEGKRTGAYLRMSNIGKPCKRQTWYKIKGYTGEELDYKTRIKFFLGHILEAAVLTLAKEAGHRVEYEQHQVEVDGVKGSLDAVIDGVLVDVKSASSYGFKKFATGVTKENDSFGYIGQLHGYEEGAQIYGKKGWLVANKETGELAYSGCPTTEYNVKAEIAEHKANLEKDTPPEKHFKDEPEGAGGNRKLCMECRYCEFKKTCWPNLRAFKYSNGLTYLTHVEKEPKVEEVCV